MNAEVIAIGDELTSGQRLDTNSGWLSQQLVDLGIRVSWHTTVDDQLATNHDVFEAAARRADIVVSTGGLGPTADDLTREVLADVAGVDLVRHDQVVEHIRNLFAQRRRTMPEQNVVQALFPRGARVIPNPHGTAPGIDMLIAGGGTGPCRIFALPGVPGEMRDMWSASVQPSLLAMMGESRRFIRHRQIRCYGAGESAVEAMLPDLVRRGRVPTVGITASQATITLRITAEADSEEACQKLIEPTVVTISECLGNLVFGDGDDELQHALIRLLVERGQTLATLECDSGGLLARWLSQADGERRVYRGGITLRDTGLLSGPMRIRDIGSDLRELDARRLQHAAARCREWFDTDYVLAQGPFPSAEHAGLFVSGTALAAGESQGLFPPGSDASGVVIALADDSGTVATRTPFAGHPSIIVARTIKDALNFLRLKLL